jgi:tetratricopeptide (TPR) repeat protein
LPPLDAAPSHDPTIQAATRQALAAVERACSLSQKGLVATAAAELRQALTQIAEALDAHDPTRGHGQALAAALAALEDAEDAQAATCACEQMQAAVGQVPAASQILQKLGQVQVWQASTGATSRQRCLARAILLQQMALAVDPANWQAANELGVLLAGSGRWLAAREALLQSVRVHPHAAGWHNLAVVHAQLGEEDLARRAAYERQRLAGQSPSAGREAVARGVDVRWVDPATFAASGDLFPAGLPSASAPSHGTTRR